MSKLEDVAALLVTEGIVAGPEKAATPSDDIPVPALDGAAPAEPGAPDEPVAAQDEAPQDVPEEGYSMLAAAEKLGLTEAELYDRIKVPMGYGEYKTVGEVKDLAINAQAKINELSEQADEATRSAMVERAELRATLDLFGATLPPDIKGRINAYMDRHTSREAELLRAAIPSWNDPDTAKRELGELLKLTARYGMSAKETELVAQDHRLVRLLRDAALKTEQPKPQPKPAGRHQNTRPDAYKRAQAPGASKADKLAGIAALLG